MKEWHNRKNAKSRAGKTRLKTKRFEETKGLVNFGFDKEYAIKIKDKTMGIKHNNKQDNLKQQKLK